MLEEAEIVKKTYHTDILFSTEKELEFHAPGTQKAPCCVPLAGVTAPVYRIPVLQITPTPLVRVMVQPDMGKVPTGFHPPLDVPQPEQVDFSH